ncbi:MAG: GTPase ObgE [Lactobacillaceae bacterium]|jgi:GTP-binding protein|nr:GTPase ObgE [Lactobacillaceae bacterium]
MAFVDQAKIEIKAGNGGNGIIAFRREPYTPMGGPYGGDGGRGGNVFFRADEGLRTLMDFRYNRHFKAGNGANGGSKGMTGASADDKYIKVPTGTIIYDDETGIQLTDLTKHGEEFMIAKGGRGGRGNMRFATPANPAPEISENGEPGMVKKVRLELRVLADVGLVGFPSAGKSTFLSVVTAAKPKIASYHFTTLSPNIGMVKLEDDDFAIADLPGLIEGASQGVGLGLEFLRHVERTKVILHFIDMSDDSGIEESKYNAFLQIRKELETYDPTLLKRPTVIVASKMDLPESAENLAIFKEDLQANNFNNLEIFEISSITQAGTKKLLYRVSDVLKNLPKEEKNAKNEENAVYNFIDETAEKFHIEREDDGLWVIVGDDIEKLWAMTNKESEEALLRFGRQLRSFGIDDALRESGAKDGDEVQINNSEFTFEFSD